MTDQEEKRLREYGVAVLPNKIDEAAYELMLDVTLIRRGNPIYLYCAGAGGSTWDALAMVDLIQEQGRVIGLQPGTAASAHLDIFLGCSQRFVFPHAGIGVHEAGYSHNGDTFDMRGARSFADDLVRLNEQIAHLYAAASNRDVAWWRELLKEVGNTGCRWFGADEILSMGMARPVAEFERDTVAALPMRLG